MSRPYVIPVWKHAPFIRLILPLIAGIIMQWYFQVSVQVIAAALISFSISFLLFFLLPVSLRFKLQPLQGLIINLLLLSFGLLITWHKDIRHSNDWYGNYYKEDSYLVVRIDEPLVEKPKSFKADGYVESVIEQDSTIPCKGKLLLYFSKDSTGNVLQYGDRILVRKDLQAIKNSGNPGTFNYQRFAAFQQIFHNVFLKDKDWMLLNNGKDKHVNQLQQFIFSARAYVLSVLRKTVDAGKDELGIAQALLIGYKNDLDKDLVQAYSNTGVVHIIAISGMHLGLIYVLLIWIFARIPLINRVKLLQTGLILICLWLFVLLTGAAASVIRAAVMFSFIAAGKSFAKKFSVYNSLATSAFLMLCYDPYFLWNVGFQLSYLAVIGIIIFQKPVYNCLYIKNKWADKIWQLMAVFLAAQLLPFSVCIFYFYQFPNFFLITNIIAVPLAGFILYAEILLIAFSWIPFAGLYLGKLVGVLTGLMNKVILWVNDLSFAVWDKIPATVFSTWLLYAIVAGAGAWLITKNKSWFKFALISLLVFSIQHINARWQIEKQEKIIIYNVPQHQAIDFVKGSNYQFVGDSILLEDGMLQNFHLKPGRIFMQLNKRVDSLNTVFHQSIFYQYKDKKIGIIDKPLLFETQPQKTDVDILIISKNPGLSISQLANTFNCKLIVFDTSNPLWKIEKWQKECMELNLKVYSIPSSGALVYNIGI